MSIQQQIQNCETFLKHWAKIKPEQVAPELAYWNTEMNYKSVPVPENYEHSCDTIACAGGWLSAMPEFQAMGVTPNREKYGAPTLRVGGKRLEEFAVERLLFGQTSNLFSGLFSGRSFAEIEEGTDHEVVTRRFKEQIVYLEHRLCLKT